MNKGVRKFFDDLESIGSLGTELVDLSPEERKFQNNSNENQHSVSDRQYQVKHSQNQAVHVVKPKENEGDEIQHATTAKEKELLDKLDCMRDEKTTKRTTHLPHNPDHFHKTSVLGVHEHCVTAVKETCKYISTPSKPSHACERRDFGNKANDDSIFASRNKKSNDYYSVTAENPKLKSTLPLTEADWKIYRDSELRKSSDDKCSLAEHSGKYHSQKVDRMSVLQNLCDRLDAQSKPSETIHVRNKPSSSRRIKDKAVNTGERLCPAISPRRYKYGENGDKSNTSEPVQTSHETITPKENAVVSVDAEVLDKPKGIIKNWPNNKSNLRRSKSDSSKYSYVRDENLLNKDRRNEGKLHHHVTFADILDEPAGDQETVNEYCTEAENLAHELSGEIQNKLDHFSEGVSEAEVDAKEIYSYSSGISPRKGNFSNHSNSLKHSNTETNKMRIVSSEHEQVPLKYENVLGDPESPEVVNLENIGFTLAAAEAIETSHIMVNEEVQDRNNSQYNADGGLNSQTLEKFDLNSFRSTIEKLKNEFTDKRHETNRSRSNTITNDASLTESDSEGSAEPLDAESSVSEDCGLDDKTPSGYSRLQSNGVKVSNARIAAYVRRRLKPEEYPSSSPTRSLMSSYTDSLFARGQRSSKHLTGTKEKSKADLTPSTLTLEHASRTTSQKQLRPIKEPLPSSEEMLFDT